MDHADAQWQPLAVDAVDADATDPFGAGATDPFGAGARDPAFGPALAAAPHLNAEPAGTQPGRRSARKRLSGAAAGAGALIAKFAAQAKALLLLLPKLKLITTAGSALISIAAYSLFWGWRFGAGLVALLFIHEMGHVIQLRREGIRAGAPTFIPFLGAVIASRSLGEDALAEAKVGLAGPVLGSAGAALCLAVGELTGSRLLMALAYIGFLINLFNLIPVVPLDGGRAMAAMAPALWFVGFAAVLTATVFFPNPFMVVVLAFAGFELWRRWRHRRSRMLHSAAYYVVARRSRLLIGAVYVGLVVLLAAGMDASHVARALV